MSRARVLALLVLLGGCGPHRLPPPDPTLADVEGPPLEAPRTALDALAASTDPVVRGVALASLVRAADAAAVADLAARAAWDPDPWVQDAAAVALLDRGDVAGRDALRALAVGDGGDPYTRARAAHALLDRGDTEGLDLLRTAWEGPITWRTAPLALVAVRLGVTPARDALARALAAGGVRDDVAFLADLGRFGWPELDAALARGASLTEEEGSPRVDVARALLAGPAGRPALRALLRDRDAARDTLDVLLALPAADRAPWLREALAAGDPAVRAVAAAWADPTPGSVGRALRHPEPFARLQGARAAAELAPDAARTLLARALEDEDPSVRAAAAGSVGALGLADLAPTLESLARDDRAEVRVAAYAALLRLGVDVSAAPAG